MAGWRVDDDREPQNGITHAHTKHVYDTYRIYIYTQPQAHTHALHMCAVGRAFGYDLYGLMCVAFAFAFACYTVGAISFWSACAHIASLIGVTDGRWLSLIVI